MNKKDRRSAYFINTDDFNRDNSVGQVSLNDEVVEVTTDIAQDRDKIIDFSKMNRALGVKTLGENNAFENKNIGHNGGGPEICSEVSAGHLYDEFSGILSFN